LTLSINSKTYKQKTHFLNEYGKKNQQNKQKKMNTFFKHKIGTVNA